MEVVDTQVHLNRLLGDWESADNGDLIERSLCAMDAVGVDAALIDERTFHVPGGPERDMRILPNGAIQYLTPFGEMAVERHPDRFAYLSRIDRRDPDYRDRMVEVRDKPGAVCLRVQPTRGEAEPFARGDYIDYLEAAQELGLPTFIWLDDRLDLLEAYLKRLPRLSLIVDHCGVKVPKAGDPADRAAQLDRVIALARYPNVSLKWCKAENRISTQSYPYRDLWPQLRRVVDAFGAERVMWASDATSTAKHHPWAQSLYALRACDTLSETEKEWILGKSARTILNWPAPKAAPIPWQDRAAAQV